MTVLNHVGAGLMLAGLAGLIFTIATDWGIGLACLVVPGLILYLLTLRPHDPLR